MAKGSVPGSPSISDSSGGSDLMALLDRELENEVVEAGEQDSITSAAEMCAGIHPVQLVMFRPSLTEQLQPADAQKLKLILMGGKTNVYD